MAFSVSPLSQYLREGYPDIALFNLTAVDDRSNILAWLSPLDPKSRHQGIRDRRVGSVGEWLLETEEFRSWHPGNGGGESNNSVLFCYGDPGVGKTFIRYYNKDESRGIEEKGKH